MEQLLDNPVFSALCTGDKHLSSGTDKAKYFDESISPFAGFPQNYSDGFQDLYTLLPAGRVILYATPNLLPEASGWQVLHAIEGLQFIWEKSHNTTENSTTPVPLDETHVDQMIELASLTKPGPFAKRTIDFGHYYGFFEGTKLFAMTGQRLHIQNFTEISAVCTHPSHLGKGYAQALVQHQIKLITSEGQTPFLHVRKDNLRAIALYERLGFKVRTAMNFYVLKRKADDSI